MPGINLDSYDTGNAFEYMKGVRSTQTSKDLCFGNTKVLKPFMKESFAYHFEDEPRYDFLKSLLQDLKQEQNTKRKNE